MQAVAFKEVPFIPLGEYYLPSALRTSITDVVHCGNTSFWGARKTA
jgi:peptide/nickel transport system substrate-binding protein